MIRRFRKKPIEITAAQWTGENFDEIAEFIDYDPGREDRNETVTLPDGRIERARGQLYTAPSGWSREAPLALVMLTAHGETAVARPGDWVIPEPIPGRAYSCQADIFAGTYDEVTEGSP